MSCDCPLEPVPPQFAAPPVFWTLAGIALVFDKPMAPRQFFQKSVHRHGLLSCQGWQGPRLKSLRLHSTARVKVWFIPSNEGSMLERLDPNGPPQPGPVHQLRLIVAETVFRAIMQMLASRPIIITSLYYPFSFKHFLFSTWPSVPTLRYYFLWLCSPMSEFSNLFLFLGLLLQLLGCALLIRLSRATALAFQKGKFSFSWDFACFISSGTKNAFAHHTYNRSVYIRLSHLYHTLLPLV